MVRFTVLASGSKGNAAVLTAGRTRILIDAGISCRELFRRMQLAEEDPSTLSAIIITHEHADHINGLSVTARKLGIPVFFTEATHRAWVRQLTPQKRMTYADWLIEQKRLKSEAALNAVLADANPEANSDSVPGLSEAEAIDSEEALDAAQEMVEEELAEVESTANPSRIPTRAESPTWLPAVEYFTAGVPFTVGDAFISPFTIPHDAADPVGFVFESEGIRVAIATDLGYIPPNVKAALRNLDVLHIESNHDLEMLRDGPYPWAVKQRVLSRVGHLSNDATSEFLENEYDGRATYVILAHLSESNNLPDIARVTAERALAGHASLLANRLLIASQHEPMTSIKF